MVTVDREWWCAIEQLTALKPSQTVGNNFKRFQIISRGLFNDLGNYSKNASKCLPRYRKSYFFHVRAGAKWRKAQIVSITSRATSVTLGFSRK